MKIAVIGGGLSGLSAAYRLREAGHTPTVFEAAPQVGGKIHSEMQNGYLVEHGPNGFLSSRTAMVNLARDVGLGDALCEATDNARDRFLLKGGALVPVPTSPGAFLRSPILSFWGRLRVLWEFFVRARRTKGDESVYDFARRRLGTQAADFLVDPMVTGIYAGDVRQLSLPAAFPRLAQFEAQYGGLFRGLIKARKASSEASSGPGRLTSFPQGMGQLIRALETQLGSAVHRGRPVRGLTPGPSDDWHVHADGGETEHFDTVVLTIPTFAAAPLVAPFAPQAVTPMESIPYAPAVVVALGYPRSVIENELKGFGFLVPSGEKRDVLGVLWSSSIFHQRAPDDHVLLRAIVGGVRRPDLVALDDEALTAAVIQELGAILGGDLSTPTHQRVVRWPKGIPQYTMGHGMRVQQIREALAPHKGIFVAGNGIAGVSVADCAGYAETLPDLVR